MHIFELRAALGEDDIRRLVHAFYGEVRRDDLLAPVFDARIRAERWPVHLERMVAFWSSALLGRGGYRGNPMTAHLGLGVGSRHFQRWLELFGSVAVAELGDNVGAAVHSRAVRMGDRLLAAVDAHTAGSSGGVSGGPATNGGGPGPRP